MNNQLTRRSLVKGGLGTLAALSLGACNTGEWSLLGASEFTDAQPFKISLAQWSIRYMNARKQVTTLQFPAYTRKLGIDGVEYVSGFFQDKAKDKTFLTELKNRCTDNDIRSVLIMCDGEGAIGAPQLKDRLKTVDNHKRWVEAAQFLGCHTIRINCHSRGSRLEQSKLCTDGIHRLATFAQPYGNNIVVENHGGLSSDGQWWAQTIGNVKLAKAGTLPDFGNFGSYDRYKGLEELMPYAKGVSAKATEFNAAGEEKHTDFLRMMQIVKNSAYKGYVGIEWGGKASEAEEAILKSKRLLEKCFRSLA